MAKINQSLAKLSKLIKTLRRSGLIAVAAGVLLTFGPRSISMTGLGGDVFLSTIPILIGAIFWYLGLAALVLAALAALLRQASRSIIEGLDGNLNEVATTKAAKN